MDMASGQVPPGLFWMRSGKTSTGDPVQRNEEVPILELLFHISVLSMIAFFCELIKATPG
jgi:hypothetical protein